MKKSRLMEMAGLNESTSLQLTPEEVKKLSYHLEMEVEEMQNKGDQFFKDEIQLFTDILNKLK